MIQLTKDDIDSEIKSNKNLVIDFGAEWCLACVELEKAIEKIKSEFSNVKFTSVDASKYTELSRRYNVKMHPTTLIFKDGKEVKRFEGFNNIDDLRMKIRNCI